MKMNDSEKNAMLVLQKMCDIKSTENTIVAETINTLYNLIKRQQAEIDRLNIEINIETVKSKAVREFAEKLKEYCNEIANQEWNKRTLPVSWADAYKDFIDDIDQLLEEMGCNDG